MSKFAMSCVIATGLMLSMGCGGASDISSAKRSVVARTHCGDGRVDEDEECDDGNNVSGDGCSATCDNEGGAVCGNGIVEAGEACDDGNDVDDDECNNHCQPC